MAGQSGHLAAITAEAFNPGPSAQMYGSLAAVLAGFAFAGLLLYLEQQRTAKPEGAQAADSARYTHIKPRDIVTTLFFAMSGLTICAFLYGRVAGESYASGRTFLILGLYGIVLAPAVLSLFYALNLVMLTHAGTRETAERTRWVVAAVGPAVVIGFLADMLAYAWRFGCEQDCALWALPRLWGFWLAAGFVVFGLLMTSVSVRELRLLRRPVRWMLTRQWIRVVSAMFRSRPHYPASITLYLAAGVGIVSILARGAPDSLDPRYWTHAVLVFATVVMGVFAFAAGSVLDEPYPRAIESKARMKTSTPIGQRRSERDRTDPVP